jgi:hypothetical protein
MLWMLETMKQECGSIDKTGETLAILIEKNALYIFQQDKKLTENYLF